MSVNKSTLKKEYPIGRRGYVEDLGLQKHFGTITGHSVDTRLIVSWDNPARPQSVVDAEEFNRELLDIATPPPKRRRTTRADKDAAKRAEQVEVLPTAEAVKEAFQKTTDVYIEAAKGVVNIQPLPDECHGLSKRDQIRWCLLHGYPRKVTFRMVGCSYQEVFAQYKWLIKNQMITPEGAT